MWYRLHIIICILFLGIFSTYAQETREDIEKQAEKHFKNEEFIEATPLYLRLLSLEARNPNYNYKYGTCLLFNSNEKKKAFKYLNFAVTKNSEVDDEAYYYLGKAYHLTYQFNKAIKNYEIYKDKAGSRAISQLDVDRQIQMCKNGKSLLSKVSETVVLKKQEISKAKFFRIYDLQDIGGELIVTEDFQTREDKKNNHTPLIHFPAKSDRIFYSSYGDGLERKDIFMRTRLPDGSWSKEQPIFGEVNSEYDEDYPYMHPSGKYLYFCSKGHNSMGGYDVFKSKYNTETNTFEKPENLDIAISSPDNDFLYIVDSLDKYAYFASQRESQLDKVNVYHVRVERFPIQMVVLKGTFASSINPSNKELTISIENAADEDMGEFKTDNKGGYLINLPKGGKYVFTMNVEGNDKTYQQTIELPYLKEFKPLKQKIIEQKKEGEEVVLIQNLFDEEFDDPSAIMAEVIEQKSKMEVNKNEFDLDSLDQIREQRKLLSKVGLEDFSNIEIKSLIDSKYEDLSTRLENSESKIQKALQTIENGNSTIEKSLRKSDSLMELAKTETSQEKKDRYIILANRELNRVNQTQEDIKNAKVILEFLEEDLDKTKTLVEQSKVLKDEIDNIDTDDDKELLNVLNKHKSFVENELKEKTLLDAQFEYLSEIESQLKELENDEVRKKKLKQQKKEAEKEIKRLKEEVSNAKRKKKEELEMELSSKENELSDINNEIEYTEKLLEKGENLKKQKNVAEKINDTPLNEESAKLNSEEVKKSTEKYTTEIKEKTTENEKIAKENNVDLAEDDTGAIADNNSNNTSTNNSNKAEEEEENNNNKSQNSSQDESEFDKLTEQYQADLEQINERIQNGENTKENLIKRKKTHRNDLLETLDKVSADIATNGDNEEKTKRKNEIKKELNKAENEIAKLEEQPSDETTQKEITASEKEFILSEVDPEYEEEIEELEDDYTKGNIPKETLIDRKAKHQGQLVSALNKINQDINQNGENSDNATRKSVIKEELEKVESEIIELSEVEEEQPSDETTQKEITASEKEFILSEVDPEYDEEIEELKRKYKAGSISIDDVVQRKEKHQGQLVSALNKINQDINQNGENSDNTTRKSVIKEELEKVESELIELSEVEEEQPSDETTQKEITASEKEFILSEVDPEYEEEIEELERKYKAGSISIDDVVQRKEKHKEQLEEAKNKIDGDISKNGANNDNTARKSVIEDNLNKTKNELSELNQLKESETSTDTKTSGQERAEIISSVDPKYSSEIDDLSEDFTNNNGNKSALIKRNEKYIDKLEKAIEQTDAAINSGNNVEENKHRKKVFENEKNRVSIEIEDLEQSSPIDEETIAEKRKNAIDQSTLSEKENDALNSDENDLKTLKRKEKALGKIVETLKNEIRNTTNVVEKRDLKSTLELVEKERRNAQIKIGDLSQDDDDVSSLNNETVDEKLTVKQKENISKNEENIATLSKEKKQIHDDITSAKTDKDVKKSEKKLNKINTKIAKEEVEILNETTTIGEEIAIEKVEKIKTEETNSLEEIEAEKELHEAKRLKKLANDTKDPLEKAALLKEAEEKQAKAIEKAQEEQNKRESKVLIDEISSSNNLSTIDFDNVSGTKSQIEEEQVNIGIRLMEIEESIAQIDVQIPEAKRKDLEKLNDQKEELENLQQKLVAKKQKNDVALEKINNQKAEDLNKGIEADAIEKELEYKDEVEIAKSEEYKEISRAVNTLEQKQYELKVKEEFLLAEKEKLQEQLSDTKNKKNPTEEEKAEISETLAKIDKTNKEIETLRSEIENEQENISIRLPKDPKEREVTENMIARNVDPIVNVPKVKTRRTGLVILDENKPTYSEENPIPLEPEKPEGLVFRVQIGAFSKPVPNETFNDFSPVSGEEVRPGLIRYMAGYFGSKNEGIEAQNKIRELGYSDAFIVAYCDGERIPVYRAEELLASGACVPTISTSDNEISMNTDANGQSETSNEEIDAFSYNKAPGAAEAEAAEKKMGLYYTVQIGVYNKPVPHKQLYNITPLITKRLSNGQIRYSTGVYDGLYNAREKRAAAIDSGIVDAYIVAYYKGKRISVSQAEELIQENGKEIFELNNPTEVNQNKVERKDNLPEVDPEPYFKDRSYQIQFVSEKTYDSYPTQTLQRYNKTGELFYFDKRDKKIKSTLHEKDKLPDLIGNESEFTQENYFNGYKIKDLSAAEQDSAIENRKETVYKLNVTVLAVDLNDDLIQTIINSSLLKNIETTERGLKVEFYETSSDEEINQLQIKLARYGATRIKKSTSQMKFTN